MSREKRILMTTNTWDPTVPHCMEERRYITADGRDGGGHSACLEVLYSDGSCPLQREHHSELIQWLQEHPGSRFDDWAHEVFMTRTRYSYMTLEVTTRNSQYDLCIGGSRSTLECVKGTYEDQEWNARPLIRVGTFHANSELLDLREAWEQAATRHLRDADRLVGYMVGEPIVFQLIGGKELTTSDVTGVRWKIG